MLTEILYLYYLILTLWKNFSLYMFMTWADLSTFLMLGEVILTLRWKVYFFLYHIFILAVYSVPISKSIFFWNPQLYSLSFSACIDLLFKQPLPPCSFASAFPVLLPFSWTRRKQKKEASELSVSILLLLLWQ